MTPDLRNFADGVSQELLHSECVGLGRLAQVPHVRPQLLGLLLQHPQLVVHLRGEPKVCKGQLSVGGGGSPRWVTASTQTPPPPPGPPPPCVLSFPVDALHG